MAIKPALPYNRGVRQRAIALHRGNLPSSTEMIEHVLSVYHSATEAEIEAGETWYWSANVEAERVTDGHINGPAIVAAMSPQVSWGQNLVDVAHLMAGELDQVTQTEINVRKAVAIIGGAEPDTILGGRKVRSFWHNIQEPDRPGPVTIDRHALAICCLGVGIWPEYLRITVQGRILERLGNYQMIASVYRSAARMEGKLPQHMQAITWLTWRRMQQISWANNDPF